MQDGGVLSVQCCCTPSSHHTLKGYMFWLSDASHSGVSNHDKLRRGTISCPFAFSFVFVCRLLRWHRGMYSIKTFDWVCFSLFLFVLMVIRPFFAIVFGFIHTSWMLLFCYYSVFIYSFCSLWLIWFLPVWFDRFLWNLSLYLLHTNHWLY